MKDKIKEFVESGENTDCIINALEALVKRQILKSEIEEVEKKIQELNGEKLKQAVNANKKPVDMSVFVDSPIDCEFVDTPSDVVVIDRLAQVPGIAYKSQAGYTYNNCKPRMNYWFSVDLFKSNEDCEAFIDKLDLAGFIVFIRYFRFNNIKSFKITGKRGPWPWECE